MKRRICYVTGTRADFAPMRQLLLRARADERIDLGICVTGIHLSAFYGNTVREIEDTRIRISARIPVELQSTDGPAMARAISQQLAGMTDLFERERPDLVLLMGDRGEMLAGAIAAIHQNIPLAHVHGGERSGTVDEPVRHSISKLSHYHFAATDMARERLIRMGEVPDHIFVTGAPGLDDLKTLEPVGREELCRSVSLDSCRPVALIVYHPVVQTATTGQAEVEDILQAVIDVGCQAICLTPNSDAGGNAIRSGIARFSENKELHVATHLDRHRYLSWLRAANVMVGNSSSGIIEAASFGLPVLNIGDRQHGRERNDNTTEVPPEYLAIRKALTDALAGGRFPIRNRYGDGQAGERIVELLATLPITATLLKKSNAY